MNKRQLYYESIRFTPTNSFPFDGISGALQEGERITLPDGREMDEVGLLLESYRLCRVVDGVVTNLAAAVPPGQTVTLPAPDGRVMNKKRLLLEALRVCGGAGPGVSPPFRHLAAMLQDGETVTLPPPDGRTLNNRELYIDAVHMDSTKSRAFIGFAVTLREGETVTLHDGRTVDAKQLLKDAFSKDFNTYYSPRPRKLNYADRSLNERQTFLTAFRSNDLKAFAKHALQRRLAPGERFVLPDNSGTVLVGASLV
jgi:hypothetical protein